MSSKLNSGSVNVSITPSALPAPAPESPRDPRDDEDSEDDENDPPLPIPGHRVSYMAMFWVYIYLSISLKYLTTFSV